MPKRKLQDYLDTLNDADTIGREYVAEAIYVARRDDVLDEPTPDDLKPIIRDLPETLTADQARAHLACELLANPEDGRDKGRGALADRLGVDWRTVQRWLAGETNPGGPAGKIIEQIVEEEP